jgi:hypothetical protein
VHVRTGYSVSSLCSLNMCYKWILSGESSCRNRVVIPESSERVITKFKVEAVLLARYGNGCVISTMRVCTLPDVTN